MARVITDSRARPISAWISIVLTVVGFVVALVLSVLPHQAVGVRRR